MDKRREHYMLNSYMYKEGHGQKKRAVHAQHLSGCLVIMVIHGLSSPYLLPPTH